MSQGTTLSVDVRAAAERLAKANVEAEPHIKEVYWFPSKDEIHLVEIDPTGVRSNEITPFYFDPDPKSAIPFPSGIAMIRPEEKGRLAPPQEWGTWDQAIKIWPRN